MSVLLRIPPLVPPLIPGYGWSPGIAIRPALPVRRAVSFARFRSG